MSITGFTFRSEIDLRRQILTYKVGPRTERVNITHELDSMRVACVHIQAKLGQGHLMRMVT